MEKRHLRKAIVIIFVFLLVGTSILPGISGKVVNTNRIIIDEESNRSINFGDQYLDLVVSNGYFDEISVLLNDGNGDFSDRYDYPVKNWPTFLDIGDFNMDGFVDIAVVHQNDAYLRVLFNDGIGGFSDYQDYSVNSPNGVATGDFDEDGDSDLAVADQTNDKIKIFYNDGFGDFPNTAEYNFGDLPEDVITADFDNDGNLDLATCKWSSGIYVIYGNGNGGFSNGNSYVTSDWGEKLYAADMNNDGYTDIGVAMKSAAKINILINDGNGNFGTKNVYSAKDWAHSIILEDFNEDGYNDAAAVVYWDDEMGVWLNDGSGGLGNPTYYSINDGPEDITTGDYNNDGHLDLASSCSSLGKVSVLYGDGNGGFGNRQDFSAGSNLEAIVTANLNPFAGNIPPTVNITYPEEGDTVSEVVIVTGTSNDPDGTVTLVEVKIDNDDWDTASGTTSWSYDWDTTQYGDGSHIISARSYDGEDYSDIVSISVYVYNNYSENHSPILTTYNGWPDGVDPDTGDSDTTFNFKVHYYDPDGDGPPVKNVVIDGSSYSMSGSGSDSDYSYSKSGFSDGEHSYYFYFEDGNGGSDRLPSSGTWSFYVGLGATKPSWDVGKFWYYKVNKLDMKLSGEYKAQVYADPFLLYIQVAEKTSSNYKLNFEGEITAEVSFKVGEIPISGDLDGDITGYFYLQNDDLGLEKMKVSVKGTVSPGNIEIRFNQIIEPKNVDVYNVFDFPIYDGEIWTIPTTKFTVSATLEYKIFLKWREKHEEHTITENEHDIECVDVTNDVYHVKGIHDDGISEYWYYPSDEDFVKFNLNLDDIKFNAELNYCPPGKPVQPSGKTKVKVGETCMYSTLAVDPNDDMVKYGWDWDGDKDVDEWTDFVDSGETCIVYHTWTSKELENGNSQIFVRAQDINGEIGVWSDPLGITKPRNRVINTPFLNFLQIHPNAFPLLRYILGLQ